MLLVIDVGNTNIVIGGMKDKDVVFTERISTDTGRTSLEYVILFRQALELHHVDPSVIEGAIISSVVPAVTPIIKTALRKISVKKVVVLGPGTKTGLSILVDDPATVGADLVAGAVGAMAQYKPPMVIVDMGTATTLCAIDSEGNYLGGSILPGLRLSLDTLVSNTSMLQGISLDYPKHAIGRNTVDAMRSGLVYGHAAIIDGLLDRMEEELGGEVTVIATGGLAKTVVSVCRHEIILDDTLLLTGMKVIYDKNA